MNLVVGGVFAPAYLLLLPTIDSQTVQSLSTKCHKIDWINTVIFLASTVCLAVAITFGGVVFSFKSGTMIALWVSTGVLLTAFIFTLKHHPFVERKDRLYPAHSLGQSDLLALQILVFPSSGIVLVGYKKRPG
jgi:quinol-cytochrome oxidoreductase complex cytochrome b subunit